MSYDKYNVAVCLTTLFGKKRYSEMGATADRWLIIVVNWKPLKKELRKRKTRKWSKIGAAVAAGKTLHFVGHFVNFVAGNATGTGNVAAPWKIYCSKPITT